MLTYFIFVSLGLIIETIILTLPLSSKNLKH